jgi:hypothetical protein
MSYDYSAVCVVPVASVELGNRLAEGLGHGPNNYTVPLSANGSEPATHYGCRAAVNEVFVAMVQSASQGELPAIDGMTPQEVAEAFGDMSIDIQPANDPYSHFVQYTGSLGLTFVVGDDGE